MEEPNLFENVSAETLDTFVTLGVVSRTYYYFASVVAVSCLFFTFVSLLGVKRTSPNFTILSCISFALFFSTFVNIMSSVMYSITWEHDQTNACTVSVRAVIAFYILHLTAMLLFLYQRSEIVRISSAAKEARFVRVLRKVTLIATLGTPPGGITTAILLAHGSVYQGRCLMVYDPILTLLVLVLNTILSAQYLLLFMIPLISHWRTAAGSTRQPLSCENKIGKGATLNTTTTATSNDKLKRMAKKNMIMSTAAITTSVATFIYNCLIVQGDPNFFLTAHLFGTIDMGVNGVIILFSTSIWIPVSVKKKFVICTQRFAKRSTQVAELPTAKSSAVGTVPQP